MRWKGGREREREKQRERERSREKEVSLSLSGSAAREGERAKFWKCLPAAAAALCVQVEFVEVGGGRVAEGER